MFIGETARREKRACSIRALTSALSGCGAAACRRKYPLSGGVRCFRRVGAWWSEQLFSFAYHQSCCVVSDDGDDDLALL